MTSHHLPKNLFNQRTFRDSHTKNIFLTIITIVIIIISILALGMYNYFKDASLQSTNNYIKDSLSQISTVANTMKNTGQSLSLQLMSERDIIPILAQAPPSANKLSIALKRLDTAAIMNSQIHSVYIYNGYLDTFYTNLPSTGLADKNSFFDKDIIYILENLDSYDTSVPIPRNIPNHTNTWNTYATSNVYTFINYTTTLHNNEEVITAAIINLSAEYLQDLISSMSNNKPHIFITNHAGILITPIGDYPMLTDLSMHPAIQSVIHSPTDSGYFLTTLNNSKSIVTYITSPFLDDWYFVQLTPYINITNDLINMRNYTFLFGLILLILGGLYTLIATKKLSSPIHQLEDAFINLKNESRENTAELKYHFLNSLLVTREIISKSYIDENFSKYRIPLDPDCPYKIILLDLKPLSIVPALLPIEDPQLLAYSIINIAEELGEGGFNCTCIPITDSRTLCLLNINPLLTSEDLHLQIENYLYTVLDRCKKLLNISLNSTISTTGEDLTLLPTLYQDLIGTSLYHLIYQEDTPLFQEFIEVIESLPFTYPQELHQFLFDNLKLGNIHEVLNLYTQIIDYACNYSYTAFMSTLLHLTYTINVTIPKLNLEGSFTAKYNQNNFITFIKNADSLELINQSFTELFTQLCIEINNSSAQRKEKNYNELIDEIYRLVNIGYSNPDTCIQSISEQLNISAAYLGRLFTKLTNESITQCITNKRLEVACHLLSDTNDPISQISEVCGFSSINYFYKVFKKAYGITPSNYRKNASS